MAPSEKTPIGNSPFLAKYTHGWMMSSPLFAKLEAKGGDEEVEGWEEPDEADLLANDEFEIDVDVEEIEDDSFVVVADGDEEELAADDDEDDDDVDIDVSKMWDDDDEDNVIVAEADEEEEADEYEYEYEYEEGEEEAPYMGSESKQEISEWDGDEADEAVPLQDDPDDPDYMEQKKLVEETVARREKLAEDQDFDAVDYIMNQMTEEQAEIMNSLPSQQEVDRIASDVYGINDVDADDVDAMDLDEEIASTPDLMDNDPWENKQEENILGTGVDDDILERLDDAWKLSNQAQAEEPWDKVDESAINFRWEDVADKQRDEMYECLNEIGGAPYNCTRWLFYDLNFNVSNLILAAVKHNPDAPVLFQHWYPQLLTYSRYEHARDRNFDFNWDDVENADMDELRRYYFGFGYTEIPSKAPGETGIIEFDELDEEEMKMAAFENWMIEVYNAEWDKKDFDDDDIRDEDNVFSEFFEMPDHPDLPSFDDAQEDLREWEEDAANETAEYRDHMGMDRRYTHVEDEEFTKEFRGHLIVACTPQDKDLEIAEKITAAMGEKFGKQVYVETRVIAHAREEDAVFEVWLESYDIDLLHSKKRASSGTDGWDGPAECDEAQIEYLVDKVGFLISDDARYSYRYEENMAGTA